MPIRARLGAFLLLSVASLPCAPAVSAPADSLDAAAARRRAEILRAPYARSEERRALRGGELVVSFDAGVPSALRDDLSRDLAVFVSALVERDGWPRPFSARSPLLVLFSAGPGVTAAGWEGREQGGRSPFCLFGRSRPQKPPGPWKESRRGSCAALWDPWGPVACLPLQTPIRSSTKPAP